MTSTKNHVLDDPALANVAMGSTEWFETQRDIIISRPLVKANYDLWYELMLADVSSVSAGGAILEIGSGSGYVKTVDRSVITSDIVPGHSDMLVNAEHLPFSDGSLRGILLTHVFHHIPNVEQFLREAQRTLVPGGVVTMVDVAHTPLSRTLFGRFHPERYDSSALSWSLDPAGPCGGANQAMSWIVFRRDRTLFERRFPQLDIETVEYLPWLGYAMSGGVTKRDLVPRFLVPAIRWLDNLAMRAAPICALHWHVRLRKKVAQD